MLFVHSAYYAGSIDCQTPIEGMRATRLRQSVATLMPRSKECGVSPSAASLRTPSEMYPTKHLYLDPLFLEASLPDRGSIGDFYVDAQGNPEAVHSVNVLACLVGKAKVHVNSMGDYFLPGSRAALVYVTSKLVAADE